jgi:hypothetical protein
MQLKTTLQAVAAWKPVVVASEIDLFADEKLNENVDATSTRP